MSSQHPDRDGLSAYLEESLSIDATQWIKQHLGGCAECRAKLEREQAFLDQLNRLASIKPPADFTEGVMARVAQCPAYQPGAELPWKRLDLRRIGLWVGSAAAVFVVLAIFAGWVLVAGTSGQGAEEPAAAPTAIARGAELALAVYKNAADNASGIRRILAIILTFLSAVFDLVRNAGTAVHLALLLATVAFNYGVTRMVLNYQRRQ